MSYNRQKMENALLALIGALEFEDGRFWKGYDFDLLNSLHEQGLISQPWSKAKSAYLTPEGLEKTKALAEDHAQALPGQFPGAGQQVSQFQCDRSPSQAGYPSKPW